MSLDLDAKCPACDRPIGDHTHREYAVCCRGMNYVLPYEEVAGEPIRFPGVEAQVVGEVTVMSGFIETAVGVLPMLRFVFTGPGPTPMSRRSLEPIVLVLDDDGLRTFGELIATSIEGSIVAAKRSHRG